MAVNAGQSHEQRMELKQQEVMLQKYVVDTMFLKFEQQDVTISKW